jgi:hypothetical protein
MNVKELELKHLAPYLPYGLLHKHEAYDMQHVTDNLSMMVVLHNESVKPILRPLSQLTEQITHNGETFVPLTKLKWMFDVEDLSSNGMLYFENYYMKLSNCVEFIQTLHSWHFDTDGLIESGLAIPKEN